MRGLLLAFQFLTRLPTPGVADYEESELSDAAVWFPLVGLAIGALLLLAAMLGSGGNAWLAALLVVLAWIGISGGLHIDGAADLADALGASHASAERFHEVLKDPHCGSFGVIAIAAILLSKLVAVAWIVESSALDLWVLLLVPAWARLGTLYWSASLEPIAPGSGERFSRKLPEQALWFWRAGLFVFSLLAVSLWFALLAAGSLLLWRAYLQWRLGGMSGDCLGAGIEYCECFMLIAVGLL